MSKILEKACEFYDATVQLGGERALVMENALRRLDKLEKAIAKHREEIRGNAGYACHLELWEALEEKPRKRKSKRKA